MAGKQPTHANERREGFEEMMSDGPSDGVEIGVSGRVGDKSPFVGDPSCRC